MKPGDPMRRVTAIAYLVGLPLLVIFLVVGACQSGFMP